MKNVVISSWNILDAQARLKLPLAVLFAFFVAGLETLGIGLLLPLFSGLVTGQNTHIMSEFLDFFNLSFSGSKQTFYLAIIIISIFIIKNVLGFLINYWNISFSLNIKTRLSICLFMNYVHAPYFWHLSKNSAEIIRNINSVSTVVSTVIQPILYIFVDIIFVVALAGLLIWSDPMLTLLGLIVLAAAMIFYQFLSRKKINHASEEILIRGRETVKNIQEALASIREIHIYGRANYMEEIFREHNQNLMHAQRTVSTLLALPKYYLESIFILLAFAVGFFAISQSSISEALPILALFGVATIRLLPSLNRILSAITTIKSGLPALRVVSNDIQNLPNIPGSKTRKIDKSFPKFGLDGSGIELKEVYYTYPNTQKSTLSKINLKINWGDMIGIVGQTGAGKSTLVDLMTGLLEPNEGDILINDLPISESLNSWNNLIAYVPQHVFLLDNTIINNIAFGLSDAEINKQRVIDVLEMVSLKDFVLGLEDGIETVVGERGIRFSGGQRQRIGIARALYHNPQILVLDEATSALDNDTEAQIRVLINEIRENRILIIIAHRLSSIRDCNNIIFMKDGRVDSVASFSQLSKENTDFHRMVELSNIN